MSTGGPMQRSTEQTSRGAARISELPVAATGLGDLARALRKWPLWLALAVNEVRDRYAKSRIGVAWAPILNGVYVAVLSFIFSKLNQSAASEFTLYLASGLLSWLYMSEIMIEATSLFAQSRQLIWNSTLPRSLLVFKICAKHALIFCLNSLVLVGIFIVFAIRPTADLLAVLPAIALLLLASPGIVLLIGLIGLLFPDVRILISFCTRLMFFATPIIWRPDRLGAHEWIVHFNPFYHAIQLIRAPLMGSLPAWESVVVTAGFSIAGTLAAVGLYQTWYRRLVYWI